MRKLKIIGQTLKGKAQQVKGEIEEASGQPVKGKMDQILGKANEVAADVETKIEDSK